MNINLTPEQERIVNDELKSGHFRSPADDNGHHDEAVREMLNFVEKNRTPLQGISAKQLIHEGHRL